MMDQDNVEHVIHAFRPDLNSDSSQRPRREMSVGSGCPVLLLLGRAVCVRYDVILILIIVDPTGP